MYYKAAETIHVIAAGFKDATLCVWDCGKFRRGKQKDFSDLYIAYFFIGSLNILYIFCLLSEKNRNCLTNLNSFYQSLSCDLSSILQSSNSPHFLVQ